MNFYSFLLILVLHASEFHLIHQKQRSLFSQLFSLCNCKCGKTNREARFIGGEFTRGHEFPWLALIQIRDSNIAAPAAVISSRHIITTASQLTGLTPYDIKITLGQFDRCFPDVSSTNISVDKIIIHPDFNAGNRAHDIALIRTIGSILFERRISPICLGFPGTKYVGQLATVVGWSEQISDVAASSSCRPRKVGLPIIGDSECLSSAGIGQYISEDKGCLGIVGAPNVICGGDAGSPVMYRSHNGIYELIGIVTDKNVCDRTPNIGLYTKIDEHLSWIKQNSREGCFCIKF